MPTNIHQDPTTSQQKVIRAENLIEEPKRHVSVTIARQPDEVYKFFRRLENLPHFMKDLQSIEVKSPKESVWVMEVQGRRIEWTARITEEEPNKMISWQSVPGSSIETKGSIWFTPGRNDSTVVSLLLDYKIPGGPLAELITALSGESPNQLAIINLRRLKVLMETGVVHTTEGQPSGRDKNSEELTPEPLVKH